MTTHTYLPALPEIAAIFEEECTSLGATAVDSVQDDTRLFARAVCGPDVLVCKGDTIRGGVALRVEGPEVLVHPYTLRQICVNGAIAPTVLGTSRIDRIESEATTISATFVGVFVHELREAIRACAEQSHASKAADQMRALTEVEAATAITVLMQLAHARHLPQEIVLDALDRVAALEERSAFGVVNAVTSIARDTQDPDVRWKLETLGGTLVARARVLTRSKPRPTEALVSV